MIIFWLICAGLVAIALAFVFPPLLERSQNNADKHSNKEANIDVYRDQLSELQADMRNGIVSPEQYQLDRDEIERRLLDDESDLSATDAPIEKKSKLAVAGRAPAYAIALGIPIIAVAMYLRVGDPSALSPSAATRIRAPSADSPQGDGQMPQQRIEANVQALAERLKQNPEDVQGWIMLGRSYASLAKYSEASNAYAKATGLKTDDADLWADYAFAMAMANGQRLQGAPMELVNKALKLDPENPKALELAGTADFQAKNYQKAIERWQKILEKTPPDSEVAQALSRRINEAKSLAGTSAK